MGELAGGTRVIAMENEILGLEEAAQLFNVSVKTFIKLLKEEKVPARKIGREWRFSRKALIDWLSAGDSQQYSSSEAETRDFFNKVAQEWDTIRGKLNDDSIIHKLVDSGLLSGRPVVLDLGAGDGYLSLQAAHHAKKVISVDISAQMLSQLQSRAKGYNVDNIETIEADATDLPVDDESVDLVCASMFLHHLDDPSVAVAEIHRVLRPGGAVFIADLLRHANAEFSKQMHDTWQGFTFGEISGWFKQNGFVDIKTEKLERNAAKDKTAAAGKKVPDIFVLTAVKPK
jgi:excisionase family DNA binding protein